MTFNEIATLLALLGGAVFATFQVCLILFKNEKK